MRYPKILIVSRLNWDDSSASNTLTNLFEDYDSSKIARIYIETAVPNTKCCQLFYQISEISLVKKLLKWNLKTGKKISGGGGIASDSVSKIDAGHEAKAMGFVRSHRSAVFTIARELLWRSNGWKTKELEQFILDFNPDIVWLDGSPLILMNRLNKYVCQVAKKPTVTFLMDDVYCYESCTTRTNQLIKFFLRKYVKWTVDHCKHVFVASKKMKEEYDRIFNINSTFIAKSFDTTELKTNVATINNPVKLVYLGNVLIGRLESLIDIAECLKEINRDGTRLQIDIYTHSYISDKDKKRLLIDDGVRLCVPVSYDKVPSVIAEHDVMVFTESMNSKSMSIARLSFSTKIIDYISSGKCILAVGPDNVAPIEYFKNEDAAIVATSKEELKGKLLELLSPDTIRRYAEKAVVCCKNNHHREKMNDMLYSILCDVAYGTRHNSSAI